VSLNEGLGVDEPTPEPYAWDVYPRVAKCEVCGKRGPVTRHHVVYRQHVRNYGGDQWDPANSMLVGDRYGNCTCHAQHHAGARRIPTSKVPAAALEFAVRLMGRHAAVAYFRRYYKED
jgi:hypothetical protein